MFFLVRWKVFLFIEQDKRVKKTYFWTNKNDCWEIEVALTLTLKEEFAVDNEIEKEKRNGKKNEIYWWNLSKPFVLAQFNLNKIPNNLFDHYYNTL